MCVGAVGEVGLRELFFEVTEDFGVKFTACRKVGVVVVECAGSVVDVKCVDSPSGRSCPGSVYTTGWRVPRIMCAM